MNRNVPFPRAGGEWIHNAKSGALTPAATAPNADAEPAADPAATDPAQPPDARKSARRTRAPE